MKTIKVKPVESICIELKDKEFIWTPNMACMANYQEEIVKLGFTKLADVPPARNAAIILYSGIKIHDENFTMEEAVALTMEMGAAHYGDIIGEFNNAFFDSLNPEDQAGLKKIMAQMMRSAKTSTLE